MNKNFTIIIPHRNTPKLLKRLIDSIPERDDLEVIIVDDCSDADIVDFEHFPGKDRNNCKCILNQECHGAGYTRNCALSLAEGKWVLFADSDDFFNLGFDAFLDDYEDKIKYKGGKPAEADDYYSAAEYMISELVDYSIDNPTGLSNGDTVNLKWNVDEYGIQNDVKVKARCRDSEFKVEGLQEAESVDVFQNLDVSFQGDDGSGYVVITNQNTTEPFNSGT